MTHSEIHWLMVDTDTFICFREKGKEKKIEKTKKRLNQKKNKTHA